MNLRNFDLKPFRLQEAPQIQISGTIARRESVLSVGFVILGNLEALAIPGQERPPQRKDRLWDHTCLELFLGARGCEAYWEFNLSPAGHWNVYRFASYRKNMREEPAFVSLPFHVRREPESLGLFLDLDVGKILDGKAVEVAVCAIIRKKNGDTSHWALAHSGSRPDFHRRDGFRLPLSAGGKS